MFLSTIYRQTIYKSLGRCQMSLRSHGLVEQLDEMDDVVGIALFPCGGADLKDAAWIRRDHEVRLRGFDMSGLAAAEGGGHVRLHQVEDACAAAADIAFGDRHDGHARN